MTNTNASSLKSSICHRGAHTKPNAWESSAMVLKRTWIVRVEAIFGGFCTVLGLLHHRSRSFASIRAHNGDQQTSKKSAFPCPRSLRRVGLRSLRPFISTWNLASKPRPLTLTDLYQAERGIRVSTRVPSHVLPRRAGNTRFTSPYHLHLLPQRQQTRPSARIPQDCAGPACPRAVRPSGETVGRNTPGRHILVAHRYPSRN
jgi:hypothetical protein